LKNDVSCSQQRHGRVPILNLPVLRRLFLRKHTSPSLMKNLPQGAPIVTFGYQYLGGTIDAVSSTPVWNIIAAEE
jgi:hypothetical protein